MAKRRYTVSGDFEVLGHKPGESFTAELPPDVDEQILLDTGALTLGKDEDEKPEKFSCPACVEQELARPPKFDDLGDLQKHYADRHQGLVPPDSVPSDAEEE